MTDLDTPGQLDPCKMFGPLPNSSYPSTIVSSKATLQPSLELTSNQVIDDDDDYMLYETWVTIIMLALI
jgi:hypothetical protein